MDEKYLIHRSVDEISDMYLFGKNDITVRQELYSELKKASDLTMSNKEKFVFNAIKIYNQNDIMLKNWIAGNEDKQSNNLEGDRKKLHKEAINLGLKEVKLTNNNYTNTLADWLDEMENKFIGNIREIFTTSREKYHFYEWENMSGSRRIMIADKEGEGNRVFFVELPNGCFEAEL